MSCSIAETMRRLCAPHHRISCSWFVWRHLVATLRTRGRGRTRESGAFLLGYRNGSVARIVDFILYDDLDPHCLDTGIVRFDGHYFGQLWTICAERRLTVVADVHVHPGSETQSDSDQAHPMISRAGHVALILPRFARRPVFRRHIGIYRYLGAKRWSSVSPTDRRNFLYIGL